MLPRRVHAGLWRDSGGQGFRRSNAGSMAAAPRLLPPPVFRTVFPPFGGGLHCGHGYTVNLPEGWGGAPAGHWRAPLRQLVFRVLQRQHAGMLPPVTGGLHCGSRRIQARAPCVNMAFSRCFMAGSIAVSHSTSQARATRRIPAGHRRAPLRRPHQSVDLQPVRRPPAGHRRAPLRRPNPNTSSELDWSAPRRGLRIKRC